MRVNDLSKELGKTNKEVLAYLQSQGLDIKSHMSNMTDEQVEMVRRHFKSGETKKVAEPMKKSVAEPMPKNAAESKRDKLATPMPKEKKTEERKPADNAAQTAPRKPETTSPTADSEDDEPKKKKLTAVFRPQNAQQPRKPRAKVDPSQTGRIISVAAKEEPKKETIAEKPQEKIVNEKPAEKPQEKPAERPVEKSEEKSAETAKTAQTEVKTETVKPAEAAKETVKEPAKEPVKEEVKKAPLLEGRDRVTTLGNIFADRPVKEKKPENKDNRDNRNRRDNRGQAIGPDGIRADGRKPISQNERRQNQQNRDGRGPQGQGRPGQQGQGRPGQQGQGRPGQQGQGRPGQQGQQGQMRPGQRADGKTPISSQDTPFNKKNSNQKQNKNNYKDKNDKRYRTDDGPSKGGKVSKHPFIKPEAVKQEIPDDDIKEIVIPETINIKDLSAKMKLQPSVIVKKLFLKGQIVNVNTELTFEQAEEIALEYEIICTLEEKVDVIAELLKEDEEKESDLVSRPPVVCVMGHVDHGKTSLLDKIRQTNVTGHEAGGITQAIGAYQVNINNRDITFLDTPGHEAFTAMRMRGAQSTDIAVLVVAADDGVMPQTVEAINHAKAADVEIIVAINKIDKPAANIDRVKQELSEYQLIPEDWGGTTIFCPVSAKSGEGIENLLEMILLAADVHELKANPNRLARGLVIEAELDKGRGPVATVLVQKGTLHVGDFVAAGACSGRVRAMINDKGQRVKLAKPSTPVEILGLSDVPNAGEVFVSCESDKEAKDFAATFVTESKAKLIEDTKAKMSLDDLFSQIQAGNVKELPLIVKADVQGSVEAVKQSLTKLSNDEVQIKVIHSGVGNINESDVSLASASNAIIIGFNVKPDATAKNTAERENVDIRLYTVIYNAIEDIENAMKGMLAPVFEEKIIGHAEIRMVFKASGVGSIAGSYVLDGMFQRGCKARITREGEQIFDGNVASLKRFKDDVKEVKAGYECGLVFDGFNDIREGDQIEGYTMVEVPRT